MATLGFTWRLRRSERVLYRWLILSLDELDERSEIGMRSSVLIETRTNHGTLFFFFRI